MVTKSKWLNNTAVINPKLDKPCVKLNYCPYGQLVEEYPLHSEATKYAIEHNIYAKLVKGKGWVSCGKDEVGSTPNLNAVVGKIDEPLSCPLFGHDCPVHYLAEFT